MVVTQAAGSHQSEVQTPPLCLSESDGTRTPFPCPLCFLTPRPGTSPPVLCPPSGRSDWPAWVTCSSESQSTVGGLALFTSGTSHPNSIRSVGKAVSQNDPSTTSSHPTPPSPQKEEALGNPPLPGPGLGTSQVLQPCPESGRWEPESVYPFQSPHLLNALRCPFL